MSAGDELMLDSMGTSPEGGFEIKTHAGGPETAATLLFIADSIRSTLDEHDAPNYVEMEVKASDGKNYILTLQRKGKITPHAARLAAEAALEAAMPRTITTAEEMDRLRFQSVVLDAYETPYVCERHATDGTRNEWKPSGMNHLEESESLLYHGPVTVVHEPAAP